LNAFKSCFDSEEHSTYESYRGMEISWCGNYYGKILSSEEANQYFGLLIQNIL